MLYVGVIAGGQRLREVEWSRRLGVNRSAIREAMARLAAEGLIAKPSGRTYVVPVMDDESRDEALELRIVLEVEAVRRICRNGDFSRRASLSLVCLCDQLESLSAQDYYYAVMEADWRFHQLLVSLCGNRRLSAVHNATPVPLMLDMGRGRQLTPGLARAHATEHRQIVQALEERNACAAEAVLRGHFEKLNRDGIRADEQTAVLV